MVTGGGSGMGRAAARAFAGEGAKVVVVDLNPDGGIHTVMQIRRDGGEAVFQRADVSVAASLGNCGSGTLAMLRCSLVHNW